MNAQEAMLCALRAHGNIGQEKRAGAAWVVNCPFHQERTPSCYLYADHFKCYGCAEQGSAANFIRRVRYPHLDDTEGYTAAYADLGETRHRYAHTPRRSKIETWRADAKRASEVAPPTDDQVTVMGLAANLYTNALVKVASTTARSYAEQRNLIDASGGAVGGVGFCQGSDLLHALKVLDPQEALKVAAIEIGLIKAGPTAHYETLRGRLVIPDFDDGGRVIWMTGRAIPGLVPQATLETSKYYHLRVARPLFGAGVAHKETNILLVEGQMCVLALRSLGIAAVALSGKSVAARHVPWFWGKNVTICLDNPTSETDAESLASANETLYGQLEPVARRVDFLHLPVTVKDCSEYIQRYGSFQG